MKYVWNVFAVLVVVGIFVLILQSRDSIFFEIRYKTQYFFSTIFPQKSAALRENISTEFVPERKMPITFVDKEETLVQFLPTVFGKFESEDWRHFWNMLYQPLSGGFFAKKQYRTKSEIKKYLLSKYSDFSYFEDIHWRYFWEIVYGKYENYK